MRVVKYETLPAYWRSLLVAKMKQSPRNIRFEELDAFLKRRGFEGTQRGSHIQYRSAHGLRFLVVKPHSSGKTVNQNAIKEVLKELEL